MGDARQAVSANRAGAVLAVSQMDAARIRAVLILGGVPLGDLEDGVQHVRLKLLQEQANPQRPEIRNPAAWVAVVASRVAADWHRNLRREAGLRERLAARWAHHPPVDHPEELRVLALAVAQELQALPTQHRQVVVLRYYVDLPVRDIAQLLQIPEGTVKSRLHAAAAALRPRLTNQEVS